VPAQNKANKIMQSPTTFYREVPKDTIMRELQNRFTAEDLSLVKDEIASVLPECNSLREFIARVEELILLKKALRSHIK
jgi:hypothetical protein